MNVKTKIPFERKQKGAVSVLCTLLCVLFFAAWGCGKQNEPEEDDDDFPVYYPEIYDNYYWSRDYNTGEIRKILFQKIEGKYYIEFYSKDENKITEECINKGITLHYVDVISDRVTFVAEGKEGSGAKIFTDIMIGFIEGSYEQCTEVLSSSLYWSPFYKRESSVTEYKISSTFYVLLKPGTTLQQIEKLAKKNAVGMIGVYNLNSKYYILGCTNQSKGNALEMANLFYDSGLFEITFPLTIGSGRLN